MRIYLDNCSYNRPYDIQSNIWIKLEAEAKLFIQELVKKGEIELIWSFVLDYENSENPFDDKREQIGKWRNLAEYCGFSEQIAEKAKSLMRLGLKQMDASHIACAVVSQADYFITTDKRILNKNVTEIIVINPVNFVEKYVNEI
ncbi:MAG: hypothetical protein LBT89_03260 [Planctomycetaceae bacterium]|jgi:hypothetical protein|nr:hypothetical protein [Planctomycetaceae bacterium]